MRLEACSVRNYRSIVNAEKLSLGQLSVLVGPNNEGKSNFLRAIATGLRTLTLAAHRPIHRSSTAGKVPPFVYRNIYDYEEDFPLQKQGGKAAAKTVITFDFLLTNDEIKNFKKEIGSSLNGLLPLRLSFGSRDCEIRVVKQGPHAEALNKRSADIAKFIASYLDFNYIPAVRTAESASKTVSDLVSQEIETLEKDKRYIKALEKIEALQRPLLDRVAKSVHSTLVQFIPSVKDVQVDLPRSARLAALRRCVVRVDDGVLTDLASKGDGIQSLAAIGIMRFASEQRAKGRSLIIAIEEPESHLHPKAQHELRRVIAELASRQQVILTTHCPLFVDRGIPGSNLIVRDNSISVAKDIAEIRDVLGVRASDNLVHAKVVLIVEGPEDVTALRAILGGLSNVIRDAIVNGELAFDSLHGAGNLSYKVSIYRSQVCRVRCLLDNDQAGKLAYKAASDAGLLTAADAHFAEIVGQRESEFEDLLDEGLVSKVIMAEYGVPLRDLGSASKNKFSERMRLLFSHAGKPWDDSVSASLKAAVAKGVVGVGKAAVAQKGSGVFESLCAALCSDISRT